MKLREFNISTVDLKPHYKIYCRIDEKILPVTNIELQNGKILLVSNKDKRPLDLDQFSTRLSQTDDLQSFYLTTDKPQLVFGYRLDHDQLIFE